MRQEIWHGDCLELMKDIQDKTIDLIVTDPPFKMTKNGKSCRPNYMPVNSTGSFFNSPLLEPKQWISECFRILKDDTHFYTFCNINDIREYLNVADEVGFKLHNIIDMIKDTKMPNRWYLKYTERILFFRKGKAKMINDPTSRDYIFVNMPTLKNGKNHPTEKPLSLIEKLVENSSNDGDVIFDPFSGSGTTLLAAKNLNRQFVGIEKEEVYYKICLERLK